LEGFETAVEIALGRVDAALQEIETFHVAYDAVGDELNIGETFVGLPARFAIAVEGAGFGGGQPA
jgi:hypothetical protein